MSCAFEPNLNAQQTCAQTCAFIRLGVRKRCKRARRAITRFPLTHQMRNDAARGPENKTGKNAMPDEPTPPRGAMMSHGELWCRALSDWPRS
jgi:hypothetical protein